MNNDETTKWDWKRKPETSNEFREARKFLPIDGWMGRSHVVGMSRGEAAEEILTVGNLQSAYDYTDEMERVFGLRKTDDHLEEALTSAIAYFFDAASDANANVCSIFVGAIHNFIAGHRKLAKYVVGPVIVYPRSSHEVRTEIERQMPLAMKALEEELARAIAIEGGSLDA